MKIKTGIPFVLVILYFFFLQSVVNNRGMLGWDEAARSMGGVTLIRYLTGSLSFGDTIAAIGINHYYVFQGTFLYGPLHALSTAASLLLFGFSVQSARLPAAIFGALGILVTFFIARMMYRDDRVAVLSALFLVGSTVYFDFSTMNFSEIPITFAISLGAYLLFKIKKMYTEGEAEQSTGLACYILQSVIAGVAFGLASVTKPSAAIMSLPIAIYLFYNSKKEFEKKEAGRKKEKKTVSCGNLPVILAIPLIIQLMCVGFYWWYLKSIGFYQLYTDFWMGGRGFHPETEPFSLSVFLQSWKTVLGIFPVAVVFLLIAGLYNTFKRKPNSEEVFLLSWIGAYFFTLIASGAIGPQYSLPSASALAIFASAAMVKIIDLYDPLAIFRRQNPDKAWKLNWKSAIAAVLIVFVVLQAAMVPVYKSISLRTGNEIKGEAYNPLIIRTFLQEHIPSLFWINTRYYNGSTIDFYARNSLDGSEIDTYRTLEVNIVKDIQKNNYKAATVIFLSELSNYFDYWFTIDDKHLTYRFVTLEPGILPQYVVQDRAPKYLIMSEENKKKLIQNLNINYSKLKYSIYKVRAENNSIQLEEIDIDEVMRYDN